LQGALSVSVVLDQLALFIAYANRQIPSRPPVYIPRVISAYKPPKPWVGLPFPEGTSPLRAARSRAKFRRSLGSRRVAHSGKVELLNLQRSQSTLFLPRGARTKLMIFLWRKKGRTMCGSAGCSVWFGSLGKEWTKSAPDLEPTMKEVVVFIGAGRGGRTPTRLPSADFESAASASSAIPAYCYFSKLSTKTSSEIIVLPCKATNYDHFRAIAIRLVFNPIKSVTVAADGVETSI
jgi:hypothetical protein